MLRAALFLAALGLAGAGEEPADEPSVMIVRLPAGADFVGYPRRCPGDTADTPDDGLCMAELYQGRAVALRHLSGPRVRGATKLRLTAHARRWSRGATLLVVSRPFEDQGTTGSFAYWWRLPEENGDFCLPAEDVAKMDPNALRRAFEQGFRRRFRARDWSEVTDLRCVRA